MMNEGIQEEPFSSDAEFDDEETDTDSSSDADAKVAEDDVFDIEFFKCYSALKKRDAKIYDKDVKFFNEELSDSEGESKEHNKDDSTIGTQKAKAPRMTLLDHQINLDHREDTETLLGREPKIDLTKEVSKSYYEKELQEIKKSIEEVNGQIDSESDDDFLKVKNPEVSSSRLKPKSRINSMLDKIEQDEDISHLKTIWSNTESLSEEDKFLRDYILNKRYIAPKQEDSGDEGKGRFFSKNLDNISDVDTDQEIDEKSDLAAHHSEEKDFDKLKRIPRNATKTIRDLKEKREKKEKRLKKLEKDKKKKKTLLNEDCEDIIGDLPTKFHYRETEPNDYGLTAEELLMATDEELDKWISLKETITYRTPEEEQRLKKKYEQKRNDIELKKKIFRSMYGDSGDEADVSMADASNDTPQLKSSKSRKRRPKSNNHDSTDRVERSEDSAQDQTPVSSAKQVNNKRKKKHKRGLNHKKFAKAGVAPDRLLAYGLSKTKLKKSKLL